MCKGLYKHIRTCNCSDYNVIFGVSGLLVKIMEIAMDHDSALLVVLCGVNACHERVHRKEEAPTHASEPAYFCKPRERSAGPAHLQPSFMPVRGAV